MAEIKRLFRELYFEVFKISVVTAVADCIIFFMILLNITTLLNLSYLVAVVVSLLFLFGDILFRMNRTTLREIEKRNPQLQDILRTAKDNTDEKNFMVLAMFEDLIRKMKSVSAGSLIHQSQLFIKVIAVCILSFSVVIISANDIHVPESVFNPDTYYQWFTKPSTNHLDFYTIAFNESADLYGDPDMADLGNKSIELHINPSINEMSFDNVKEPEEKEFERGTFPSEIVATADASSEEKLPKESKIAIAYNLKLKEEQ